MTSTPPLYPQLNKSLFPDEPFIYPPSPQINSNNHNDSPYNTYPIVNNNPPYCPSYTNSNPYSYPNQQIGFSYPSSPPPSYCENQPAQVSLPYGICPPGYQSTPNSPPAIAPIHKNTTTTTGQLPYPLAGAARQTPYPSQKVPYSGAAQTPYPVIEEAHVRYGGPAPTYGAPFPGAVAPNRRASLQHSTESRKGSLGFTDPASLNQLSLIEENTNLSKSAGNSPRHSIAGASIYNTRPSTASSENSDEERTPLPANLVLLWESPSLIQLYFVQEEGYVVAARKPVQLLAYKCPVFSPVGTYVPGQMSGCLEGSSVLLFQKNTWRLGLRKDKTRIVKGKLGEIAVLDDSTNPERTAILHFPKEISDELRQRLDVLLKGSSSLCEEPTNVVEKAENGVDYVYSTLTKGVNDLFKDTTPGVHKSTKWIRKGTGSLLRMGGTLVSKGVHLVADQVVDNEAPKEFSPEHKKLLEALNTYRVALATNKITRV